MRWARLLLSLGLASGVVLLPGPVTGQQECAVADLPSIGTLELRGQDSGEIEGDAGPALPVLGYAFQVERVDPPGGRTNGIGATTYAPLTVRKPVDGSSTPLAGAMDRREALSHVVLTIDGRAGEPLFTYRFGLARIVSQMTEGTRTSGCEVEEIRLRIGAVHLTHEPSGESVIDSGQLDPP